ncbi:MAG TPA: hypothetical protein VMT00_02180 [Thermoanaerobaculia bacterium]|nr:hypothetical protein [Thermoanaerobaculia bacterium]
MAVRVLFIIYCLEAGIFFVMIPWTRFWALNPILHTAPILNLLVDNGFFRGFVSGFGVIHIVIGAHELARVLAARNSGRSR